MFNSLEDEALDEWFQRFNTPLKRLPAAERAELHQEVRQHLDDLAAANQELGSSPGESWELALTQFGDPDRIGRRLAEEAEGNRSRISMDLAAVLFGLGISTLVYISITLLFAFFRTAAWYGAFLNSHREIGVVSFSTGLPILMGLAIGRKYSERALKGAFYTAISWPILPIAVTNTRLGPVEQQHLMLWLCSWLTLSCGAAYLGSVTRRGWYKPSFADFNISLPHRKWKLRR